MLDVFLGGLVALLDWSVLLFLLLGVLIGICIGAIPGLGGATGIVIVLPFTFAMDPYTSFALLLGLFAVVSTGDTITSILLGVPGTASSQATILDGHPMAMRGEAARAFGAAFSVSMVGGVFGGLVLAASLPMILPVILAFGTPEFFMLTVLGLSMVAVLAGDSLLKGLGAALIGLLLAQIGFGEVSRVSRFDFGVAYLRDGLPLLPILLGVFGLAEVLELATRNTSISRVPRADSEAGLLFKGVRDALRNWWLVIRCSLIGVYIGLIPGLGSSVVDWFAYGHTVQSAKDRSRFGQGDVRGVIGPEAANNAVRGGSLIPTVAFGIPGSVANALLLTALLIQGLTPGRNLLVDNLEFTFSMVWMIILANVVGAVLLMAASNQIARVALLPAHIITPGVVLFVFMGAWMATTSLGDLIALALAGVLGAVMKSAGWPRPPLVLALVLGPIMEQQFHLSMRIYGPEFMLRPVTLVIAALVVVTIWLSARGIIRNRRPAARAASGGAEPVTGEGSRRNPPLSVPFAALWLGVFAYAAIAATNWPQTAARFPTFVSWPAVALFACILMRDAQAVRGRREALGSWSAVLRESADRFLLTRTAAFFGWIVGLVVLVMLVGQRLAIPAFVALYLWRWGRYRWYVVLPYAAASAAFLYVFYDRLLHIFWYPALLRL